MPRLDIYLNADLLFQVQVKPEAFWIGRGNDCLVSLHDDEVSHRHAHVVPMAGGWTVRNEGRNGTRLNASALTGTSPLVFGDRLYIGCYAIVFQDAETEALRASMDGPTRSSDRP